MGYWVEFFVFLATALLSVALAPRPRSQSTPPADIHDVEAPTADEGKPVPVIFGDVLLKNPNVVWYGDLHSEGIYNKGGKK